METFCVLPWHSLEVYPDLTTPCCLMRKNYNLDQVKKDLLAGKKTSACDACWKLEGKGIESRRQIENKFLDFKLDRDLIDIVNECRSNEIIPTMYQIATSNLCNQACVSCNSQYSTKWATLEKKLNLIPVKQWSTDINQLNINYKVAKRINLVGGEPLFDPKSFKILQNLLDSRNTDCFISFITNGSIEIDQKYLKLLEKFSDVSFCLSIDGIEKNFEYMRWPGKWNQLLKNLEIFKKLTDNISVSYTISSLNAAYYNDTVNWFKEQNLPYNHNIVHDPNWLSLSHSPEELREISTCPVGLASYCEVDFANNLNVVREKVQQQDQIKKINIRDYMPEVANILFE